MSLYRERAELKNQQLKKLLAELEKSRDLLLDEVSHKKGKVEQIEETIRRAYELILDTNKEEQQREAEDLARLAREEKEKQESQRKEAERIAFEEAKKGIKTPKPGKNRDK